MGTIKPFLAALLLVVIASESYSQSIARQSINSFGTSTFTDGYRISETVGQAYITKTGGIGSLVFHPGFQQQMVAGKKVVITSEEMHIEFFPNPASSLLRILPSRVIERALITVVDMNGKVISESEHAMLGETSFDVSAWPSGLYSIRVTHAQTLKGSSARILIIK